VKVSLPTALQGLNEQDAAWAKNAIQTQLSEQHDTLTTGVQVPFVWKEEEYKITVVAVYTDTMNTSTTSNESETKAETQRVAVDAVNIRSGGVNRQVSFELMTEESEKSEKSVKDEQRDETLASDAAVTTTQGETKEISSETNNSNSISSSEDPRLATLRALAQQSTFAPGSSSTRFMERVTDYLEQADDDTPWSDTFQHLLNAEKDVFETIQGSGYVRKIDLVQRPDAVTKPVMLKAISAPDVDKSSQHENTEQQQQQQRHLMYSMVPGGEGENITEMNKVRYLDLWLRHKLESEIDESTRWFVEGLTNVVPAGVLDMFDANELKRLLSGDALDDDALDDLFQHVKYHAPGGEPGRNELRTLFETSMAEFEPKQRQAVFRFVTSLDRIPPGGCGSLSPPFTIELDTRKFKTMSHMPESQTCMNHLLMPKYTDWKMLKERLIQASSNGMEYHLPYG
jgi:hypothetical protein